MKKGIKIFAISFASILGLVLIAITIVLWYVLTPEKITPIVKEQASKYLTCQTNIDTVDVTFFSSFPKLCLRINKLCIINPTQGVASDTVVNVDECSLALNISDLISSKVVVNEFILKNGFVNIYTDSLGHANYDIIKTDSISTEKESVDTTAFENPFDLIELEGIYANNIHLSYIDQTMEINTMLYDSELAINAKMIGDKLNGDLSAQLHDASFNMSNDFLDAQIQKLSLKAPFEYSINSQDARITLVAEMDSTDFAFEKDVFLNKAAVKMDAPIRLQLANMNIELDNALVAVNNHEVQANGDLQIDMETMEMKFNLDYGIEKWDIQKALELMPTCYASYLEGIDLKGDITARGDLTGLFNDSLLPVVNVHAWLSKGIFTYADFPQYKLRNLEADVETSIKMNKGDKSSVKINDVSFKTLSNSVSAYGEVNDLLNNLVCNLSANVDINFADFQSFIPEDLKTTLKGRAKGNVGSRFSLDDILDLKLEKIQANANLTINNINVVYDSISAHTIGGRIKLNMPSTIKDVPFKQLLSANVELDTLNYAQFGNLQAHVGQPNISVSISDYRDTTQMISAYCIFNLGSVQAIMDDSINAYVKKPTGSFLLKPARYNTMLPAISLVWSSDSMSAQMGKMIAATTCTLHLDGGIEMSDNNLSIMTELHPRVKLKMNSANINLGGLDESVYIPAIDADISTEHCIVNDCRVNIGRSDYQLKGEFKNHAAFMKRKSDRSTGVAEGVFHLSSHCSDVNELINLTSRFSSSEDSTISINTQVDTTGPNPFIVPLGINLTLSTHIDTAYIGKQIARNLGGNLYIKNGSLILEEMGFVSKAAKLQLTALYRSPRPNNLYVGLNYHMDEIQIEELLEMIPDIDTLMPMLRTFKGTGEIHLAVGTSLDGYYNLKRSTTRGSCSIQGKDLVVMDNDMFSEISKVLMFNKKTENKVDSLSAEFSIFKNEIDIYPFTIVMDKYTAIVGGRQNLDMTYDYHVSLLESPLPMRLGCNISNKNTNDATDFHVELAPCKYSQRYQRKYSTDTEMKSLRDLIRRTLEQTDQNKKENEIIVDDSHLE